MDEINKTVVMRKRQKANLEIREAIKDNDVKYYEVADELGVNSCAFSVMLRKELKPNKRSEVLEAVKRAAASRQVVI